MLRHRYKICRCPLHAPSQPNLLEDSFTMQPSLLDSAHPEETQAGQQPRLSQIQAPQRALDLAALCHHVQTPIISNKALQAAEHLELHRTGIAIFGSTKMHAVCMGHTRPNWQLQ